ncbi:MAG TPA: nuclear transport factor 2 family protein [Rhodocyclaceae bacterium]
MDQQTWLRSLFSAIDAKDAQAFVAHLTPDARFQFGNLPAVEGREAIAAMVGGFFASIAGLEHVLEESWQSGEATICCGSVTYARLDGSLLTVPFANVMRRRDGAAFDYRIFGDMSALYAP